MLHKYICSPKGKKQTKEHKRNIIKMTKKRKKKYHKV